MGKLKGIGEIFCGCLCNFAFFSIIFYLMSESIVAVKLMGFIWGMVFLAGVVCVSLMED